MTVKINAQELSYPHLNKKDLTGDIWFYREECRYLREAWILYPMENKPEIIINNADPKNYITTEGIFSIPQSFYIEPSASNDKEVNKFSHFNAVDAVICFNQLAFILIIEGGYREILPLSFFNINANDLRTARTAVNIMIAKINTTFVRPLDPEKFIGTITLKNMYSHKDMPFMDMDYRFEDNKGGLAVGSCRAVIFVHNLKK